MAITTLSIIENVLTDIGQAIDGSSIPTADVLRYLQEAERKFNDITLVLKTSALVNAIENQVEYDLPSDFKTNLFNVEYDYKSLLKQSKEYFDLYDQSWRDPSHIATLSTTPLYFCNHMVELGKLLVWPPPSSSGDSVNLRSSSGGPKRLVILAGTSYDLRSSSGGPVRTITVNSEVINLRSSGGGWIRSITPRKDNLFVEYIKEPATLSLLNNIEPKLEKYSDILEDYCKYKCFLRPNNADAALAGGFSTLFNNKTLLAKKNLDRARSKNPVNFQPVYTTADLGTKRAFVPN